MTNKIPAPPWYVVHTRPHKEVLVSSLLEQKLHLQVYLPQVLQKNRGRIQLAPLFPGYLFIQADFEQTPASAINTTPGVVRLVAFSDRPQPLLSSVVEAIRAEVDALNAYGGLPQHPYHPGDVVRFTGGPLEGLHAVFLGPMRPAQRVRVLLKFLGEQHEAEVEVDNLEPLPAHLQPKRPRRTRGKGRPIKQPDQLSEAQG